MLSLREFQKLYEQTKYTMMPKDVTNLISSMASEKEIFVDPWPEIIKKQDYISGLLGIRVYFDDKMIRVNWITSNPVPSSIDIWTNAVGADKMPEYTLTGSYTSLLMSAKYILSLVDDISAKKKVLPITNESESPLNKDLELTPAVPEETSDSAQGIDDAKVEPEITIFSDLKELVTMVIKGLSPALLVAGRGGVGKTYTVKKTLEDYDYTEGEEFVITKGAATPLSLYKALYDNRDRILIFDDCDSIFRDEDALNILKAALDSEPERRISWLSRSTYDPASQKPTESKTVPNNFLFTGSVIFITNKDLSFFKSDKLEAILTRVLAIEMSLSSEQMMKVIENNLKDILPQEKLELKKEVLEFLKSEYSQKTKSPVSNRTFIKAVKIRLSQAPNWKELVLRYS